MLFNFSSNVHVNSDVWGQAKGASFPLCQLGLGGATRKGCAEGSLPVAGGKGILGNPPGALLKVSIPETK